MKAKLYFDFYGLVDIDVWEPAYLVGRALHALQDSFAHTIRSDDLQRIRHVLNYVDAIGGALDEKVDGLPHSDHMDTCEGETEPIARTASLASMALIGAINESLMNRDVRAVQVVLDEWVTYEPGCMAQNNYCDAMWLPLARQAQTGPYLEALTGCGVLPSSPSGGIIVLFLLAGIGGIRRSRAAVAGLVLCVFGVTSQAEARGFMSGESHVSLLSDAPDRSVLANTFGMGVREAL